MSETSLTERAATAFDEVPEDSADVTYFTAGFNFAMREVLMALPFPIRIEIEHTPEGRIIVWNPEE